MKTPKEVYDLINGYFPKMNEAQKKKESAETLAIYSLARLMLEFFASVAVELSAIKKFIGMEAPKKAGVASTAAPEGDAAAWVMSGLNENDNTPSPAAATGNDKNDADWVLAGIEDGEAPANAAPLTGPSAGGNVIPNPSSPPVPKEIQKILAKQAANNGSTGTPPMPPPAQAKPQKPQPRK